MRPHRARRGWLSWWELGLGVVMLVALAAWSVPVLERAAWRTRRAEAGMILSSLQSAQQRHKADHGAWFSVSPVPQGAQSIGKHRAVWPADLPGGWTPPSRRARCSYRTEENGTSVLLRATCDVDGDGQRASYEADPEGPIRQLTAEEVY